MEIGKTQTFGIKNNRCELRTIYESGVTHVDVDELKKIY